MLTRACPVCRTGAIRAKTQHALTKRACCSRSCALAVAREVRANPPAHVIQARAYLADQVTRAAKASALANIHRGRHLRAIAEDAAALLKRKASLTRVLAAGAAISRDLT